MVLSVSVSCVVKYAICVFLNAVPKIVLCAPCATFGAHTSVSRRPRGAESTVSGETRVCACARGAGASAGGLGGPCVCLCDRSKSCVL